MRVKINGKDGTGEKGKEPHGKEVTNSKKITWEGTSRRQEGLRGEDKSAGEMALEVCSRDGGKPRKQRGGGKLEKGGKKMV